MLRENIEKLLDDEAPYQVYMTLGCVLAHVNHARKTIDGSDIYYDMVDIANKLFLIGYKLQEREKENGIKESSRRLDARENT